MTLFVGDTPPTGHLTVPLDARKALGLGAAGLVHLDLLTQSGHAAGEFLMTSGGEVRVTKAPKGPNRALVGVVHGGEWGIATASRPSK